MARDGFELHRFLEAQAAVYQRALSELQEGRKRTHWMWFIFPQIAGLGHSQIARHYALESLDEVRRYWAHPVLGPRLRECTEAVLALPRRSAHEIFGSPDDLKFRSCMTLFMLATREPIFSDALAKFFEGKSDPLTLELLGSGSLPTD